MVKVKKKKSNRTGVKTEQMGIYSSMCFPVDRCVPLQPGLKGAKKQ